MFLKSTKVRILIYILALYVLYLVINFDHIVNILNLNNYLKYFNFYNHDISDFDSFIYKTLSISMLLFSFIFILILSLFLIFFIIILFLEKTKNNLHLMFEYFLHKWPYVFTILFIFNYFMYILFNIFVELRTKDYELFLQEVRKTEKAKKYYGTLDKSLPLSYLNLTVVTNINTSEKERKKEEEIKSELNSIYQQSKHK